MKTSRNTASGQQTRARASVRSTPAQGRQQPKTAAPPALPRAPQALTAARPLGPLHATLTSFTLATLEQLGELGDALDGADGEARRLLEPDGGGATVAGLRGDIEEARSHLRFALCSMAELSATLTGESPSASMVAHAAALARLELLAGAECGRHGWAEENRKKARQAFRDDAV